MAKGGSRYQQPDEGASLMNGKSRAVPTPADNSFSKFLFNKEEGSCLGRTGKSWCQIFVFYVIFYFLLACFWLGCLKIFLATIDYELPRFYGPGTIIGVNPGVGYQPWLKDDPESTLIKFNVQNPESYETYVSAIEKYLEKYDNTNNTRKCGAGESNDNIIKDGKLDNSTAMQACRFDLSLFEKAGCNKANSYGFKDGKPCIILSVNRLIGWKPEDFSADEVPKAVADRYKKGSIAFDCDGSYDPDKEYVGQRTYIPTEGIDGRFYPYAVMPNYHQPIAMVKFDSLPKNRLVQIKCQAYAANIARDIESGLGLVNFDLLFEDFPVQSKRDESAL